MRSLLSIVAFVIGCAHPVPPTRPVACPVSVAPPPAPVAAAIKPLDEAQAIARVDAFLAAVDSHDAKAFETKTATGFLWFLHGRTYDRPTLIKSIVRRVEQKAPSPTRSCQRHKVIASATSTVVAADCSERYAAHEDMPGYEYASFTNVVLIPEDNAWKVAFWTFQTSGLESERDMWNDTLQRGMGFRKSANQHLVDAVKGRKPGRALDIAMGSGRNVLFLAGAGWKVTGVDLSDAGIKLATEAAAKQKVKFEGVVQDIAKYDLGTAKWDLVTLIYAGTDPKLIARIKPSIKKGGLFVVEFFHKDATMGTGVGGFEAGELAKQFTDGWTIVKDEVVEDIADWASARPRSCGSPRRRDSHRQRVHGTMPIASSSFHPDTRCESSDTRTLAIGSCVQRILNTLWALAPAGGAAPIGTSIRRPFTVISSILSIAPGLNVS